jgi:hypothetical protein
LKAENKVIILKAELPAYGGLSIGKWKGKIVNFSAYAEGVNYSISHTGVRFN